MELRLFPLHTVLFPRMILPLQVFEPRYRTLVAECLKESAPFGVVLIQAGVEVGGAAIPHAMGCTAQIRAIEAAPDGQLMLTTAGLRRFRILALFDDRPYLRAEVEYPVDEQRPVSQALIEEARRQLVLLEQLRHTARGEYVRAPEVPTSAGALADAIGASSIAAPLELQPLLETLDIRTRLEAAFQLLGGAMVEAHRAASAAVAERWGSVARLN